MELRKYRSHQRTRKANSGGSSLIRPAAEELEPRRLLSVATLSNGIGDGSLTLTVDAYGSYGYDSPASDTIFDPFGTGSPSLGTTRYSAVYFQPLHAFLAESSLFGAGLPGANFTSIQTNSAVSQFSLAGYNIVLTQQISDKPIAEGTTDHEGHTILTQTYQITNNTGSPQSFDMIRYVDAHMWYTGSIEHDWGGVSGDYKIPVIFDTSGQHTAFIMLKDAGDGQNNGFTIRPSGYGSTIILNDGLQADTAPLNWVYNDGDPTRPDGWNRLTDPGDDKGGNLAMALSYHLIMAPGQTLTYTTITELGLTKSSLVNFVDPGTISLVNSSLVATEPADANGVVGPDVMMQVDLVRTGGALGGVDILFGTADATAIAALGDYQATSGSVHFSDGELTGHFDIPIKGDLTIEGLERFYVSIGPANNFANPTGANSTLATILDNDGAGILQLAAASYDVDETAGHVTLTVTRTNGFSGDHVSIHYTTVDGTALAGQDYTAVSGTLSFAMGETTKTITVPILNDLQQENAESFSVLLNNPVLASLGFQSSATVQIADDDHSGHLQFAQSSYQTTEHNGDVTVTVTRAEGTSGTVSVYYTAVDAGATAGSDYTPATGVLTFANGETNKTFTVHVLDDNVVEEPEAIQLVLSQPTGGATLGTPPTALLTILDNDASLQFAAPTFTAREDDTVATIVVTRSGDLTGSSSIDYATADDTAVAGQDYTAVSGTLVFAPGEAEHTITVPLIDHVEDESDGKSFSITLSNPTGTNLLLGSPSTASVAIQNVDRTPPTLTALQMVTPRFRTERIVLQASEALDAASTASPSDYRIVWRGRGGRIQGNARVLSATYNPANRSITVVPFQQLPANRIYELTIGGDSVRDTSGNAMTGTLPGGDTMVQFGRGNRLWFKAADGDIATFSLARGGIMELVSGIDNGLDPDITILDSRADKSILRGNVQRARISRGVFSDGIVDLDVLQGLSGVRNLLKAGAFNIRSLLD